MVDFLWNFLASSGNWVGMRSFIIAVVLLLSTNGVLVASTQSSTAANAVGQMMTVQSLPDAVMLDCCENADSRMGHGYNTCAMDCHYLAPYVVVSFRRTTPVKASTYPVSLTSWAEGCLMRPPIVS